MYTHPLSAEQCLHNALKVTDALRFLGLDYDVLVGCRSVLRTQSNMYDRAFLRK